MNQSSKRIKEANAQLAKLALGDGWMWFLKTTRNGEYDTSVEKLINKYTIPPKTQIL